MSSITCPTVLAELNPDAVSSLKTMGIIIGVAVLLIVWQIAALAKFYRIPPPGHALIRQGRDGCRVVIGKGIPIIPIVHIGIQFPLTPLRVDFGESKLDSDLARSWRLPNVFLVAVDRDCESIRLAAQNLSCVTRVFFEDIILGQYQRVLAEEGRSASQDSPANRFIDGVEQALNRIGFTIIACRRQ